MEGAGRTGMVLGGRYTLGEQLGKGGWGSVFAAMQTDLGRPVAIKVLHTSVALAPDGLARFEREAKAAAALGHPNIAQVTDFQANLGEPPFLVLELLTGRTLGAVLKTDRKIAPGRMAWIAYQILAGLDVAHRAGIIHRDIKPDNVFLVAMPGVEDYVKILDFGIAKLSGDADPHLTSTGTMLGSPAFMAPEQVRGGQVDHRVDIYSLGATMYLALSGQMPFGVDTLHALLLAITEQQPPPLASLDPSIDPALVAVIQRAMHKDPAGRFSSAAEMRAALEPWLGGMAAHASATAGPQRGVSPMSMMTGGAPAPSTMAGGPPVMSGAGGPPLGSPPPGSYPPNPAFAPPPDFAPPTPQFAQQTPQFAQQTPQGAPTPNDNPYGAPPANNPYAGAPANAQSQYISAPAQAMAMTPAPAPAKSGGAVVGLLVAVVVLLLVLVGGGAAGFYFYSSRDGAAAAAASAASGAAGAPGAPATAAPGSSVAANGAPAAGAPGAPGAAGAKGKGPVTAGAPGTPVPGAPGAVAAAPGAPGAAGAPAIVVPEAGAPAAPKKQFSGAGFSIAGGSFDVFDIDASKAAINARGGAIGGCYAATEFDPPDHQFTSWVFHVDPAGNVKSVGRATNFDLHPKFDACMSNALRSIKWPATKAGGSPQINFNSRTRDNP